MLNSIFVIMLAYLSFVIGVVVIRHVDAYRTSKDENFVLPVDYAQSDLILKGKSRLQVAAVIGNLIFLLILVATILILPGYLLLALTPLLAVLDGFLIYQKRYSLLETYSINHKLEGWRRVRAERNILYILLGASLIIVGGVALQVLEVTTTTM